MPNPLKRTVGRFAPTTSGRAHPGTLLAALLASLDAYQRHGRFLLRLEDIDPTASHPQTKQDLLDDLLWFGLEWDDLVWQSECRPFHEAALDELAAQGRLYACHCSRTTIKAAGRASASGGWVYPGTCRHQRVDDWRSVKANLRVNLESTTMVLTDESGLDLSQSIASVMGDPLVRRPDGSITYQLAVVIDDATAGVNRIVRGRDIATSTATQVALYQLLGFPIPQYRHHFLLLEPQGSKMAKLHQSIGADQLRLYYTPDQLRGFLAWTAGFLPENRPIGFAELTDYFDWNRVRTDDPVIRWNGQQLVAHP